jgi:diadenosine tetraphosphate (Ap4A) HIT family hydrolase
LVRDPTIGALTSAYDGSVPESPEEMYDRVAGSLRMPPVHDWDTFPFNGEMRPRALRPPVDIEGSRTGAGGVDCDACAKQDNEYLWVAERWRLLAPTRPSGLPAVVLLEPREHYAEPGDLPDALAAECGVLLARIERAVRSIDGVGRVHVCRWGDGSEHMHWWFMARPARIPQLIGSFAAIWDDVLPPVPEDIWRSNQQHIVRRLREPEDT